MTGHDTGLSAAYLDLATDSFLDFYHRTLGHPTVISPPPPPSSQGGQGELAPHGTTIVATKFSNGVVVAGDRRATVGTMIAQRDINKLHATDSHSVVGIAGSAGQAMEMVRLLQLELEHYEKIEGVPLSIVGKANRLASLIRANLSLAMQGLAAVPLFAGYDTKLDQGRLFSYDLTGGRYEEHDYYSVGSGSIFARGSLKKLFDPSAPAAQAARACVEALVDAADDDTATAGPDLSRGIYPQVALVTSAGVKLLEESATAELSEAALTGRRIRPDGPLARLT